LTLLAECGQLHYNCSSVTVAFRTRTMIPALVRLSTDTVIYINLFRSIVKEAMLRM